MGIKDLLKLLEPVTDNVNIADFRGKCVAIDASSWLHKALYAVAEDYVDSGCSDSQLYVDFVLSRIHELKSLEIDVIMVFDGKRSLLKADTNSKRDEYRQQNLDNGRDCVQKMKSSIDRTAAMKYRNDAIMYFQRGLAVSHEMEANLISALRRSCVKVIVSPFEADCQLAYLCHTGVCKAVLTEDSDILVYAAVCGTSFPVLYKYEKQHGTVKSLEISNVITIDELTSADVNEDDDRKNNAISNCNDESSNSKSSTKKTGKKLKRTISISKSDPENNLATHLRTHFHGRQGRRMFVQCCVLAGCDYSDSIHGVGLLTAAEAILRCKGSSDDHRLRDVCMQFTNSGKTLPDNYLRRVQRAEALFHYQLIYDNISRSVSHFTIPKLDTTDVNSIEFNGPAISLEELAHLGTVEDFQSSIPENIRVFDVCEGYVSLKLLSRILPRFPWDNLRLQKPNYLPNQHSSHSSNGRHSTNMYPGLWSTRRHLMQTYGHTSGSVQQSCLLSLSTPCKQQTGRPSNRNILDIAIDTSCNMIGSYKSETICTDESPVSVTDLVETPQERNNELLVFTRQYKATVITESKTMKPSNSNPSIMDLLRRSATSTTNKLQVSNIAVSPINTTFDSKKANSSIGAKPKVSIIDRIKQMNQPTSDISSSWTDESSMLSSTVSTQASIYDYDEVDHDSCRCNSQSLVGFANSQMSSASTSTEIIELSDSDDTEITKGSHFHNNSSDVTYKPVQLDRPLGNGLKRTSLKPLLTGKSKKSSGKSLEGNSSKKSKSLQSYLSFVVPN